MTGDHLGLSVSVTKKRVSKGVLPKGAISPDSIKTRHKTKPANLYLYKCSHCLCSQACTCSYMSQECWYSSHLRHNDEFYPCIRPGLKKRKENNTSNQPRTSYINLDIQRKKIINFVASWLLQGRLIVSLIERRASINPGGTPCNGLYGEASPELQKGYLFQTSGGWKG